MSKELQSWFRDLPRTLQRDLASGLREIADDLAGEIEAAAPRGGTGNLAASVRVRRGRKSLELYVEAGGALTTKEVRKGSGEPYDYAKAQEWGTQKMPANPFFFTTYRARQHHYRGRIDDLVADVVSKA